MPSNSTCQLFPQRKQCLPNSVVDAEPTPCWNPRTLLFASQCIFFICCLVVGSAGALRAADTLAPSAQSDENQTPAPPFEPQFQRDVLPLLRRNCLACHNAQTAEADVVLESPLTMLAYESEDPLLVPGKPAAGKLWQTAAQLQEPHMPPASNEVGAKPLTIAELTLLKKWIELGAKSDRTTAAERSIRWQPLSHSHQPIIATQVSARGDICVCGRGNHLEIYDLVRGRLVARLVDPALEKLDSGFRGAAHLDMIRSLAICNDGEWIASGGYRTLKLWRRSRESRALDVSSAEPATALTVAADRGWIATGHDNGSLSLAPLQTTADDAEASCWQAHDATVLAVRFSGDGRRLVSVAADGSVRCWEIPSQKSLGAWKLSDSPQLAEMIGDELLVTASDDLLLRLWRLNLPNGTVQEAAGEPEAAPDGETALTTAESSTASANSTEPAAVTMLEPTHEFRGHGREITALSQAADQEHAFYSGGRDGFLRLWDIDQLVETRHWIHGEAIEAIAASRDGAHVASVGDDGIVKSWSLEHDAPKWAVAVDFQRSRRITRRKQAVELAAANLEVAKQAVAAAQEQKATDQKNLLAAEEKLAAAEENLKCAAIAAKRAAQRQTDAIAVREQLDALSRLAEQSSVALKQELQQSQASIDGVDRLLAQARQRTFESSAQQQGTESDSAAQSPKDKTIAGALPPLQKAIAELAASLPAVRRAEQQRAELNQKVEAVLNGVEQATTLAIAAVAASKEAAEKANESLADAEEFRDDAKNTVRRAAAGQQSVRVVIEEAQAEFSVARQIVAERRQALSQFRESLPPTSVVSAAYSDDGALLVASRQGRLFLLHPDGSPAETWQATSPADLLGAAFARAGKVVVIGRAHEGAAVVWETGGKWSLDQSVGGPNDPTSPLVGRVLALDFSPDAKLLAIGGGNAAQSGQVLIWNLAEHRAECEFDRPHDDEVLGLAFSRDGQYVATAAADHMTKVFRALDGQVVRSYEGHSHHVLDVAWRANGLQLATCSADQTIKIWDFRRGEQLSTITGASGEITAVEFLGIGNELMSAAGDRTIRVHNADDGKQIRTITTAGAYLFCCATDEAGSVVASGDATGVLRISNSADGAEKFHFPAMPTSP